MNISKNTTKTYVVTTLAAASASPADVNASMSSGQVAVFNKVGKADAAVGNEAYFVYKLGDETIATNMIKKDQIKSARYDKYVTPVNMKATFNVVVPGGANAKEGDYFSFMVRQDPASVPSSVNAVFPMASYTAVGGETATKIAEELVKAFNVAVSTQFDSPIVASNSAAAITITAQDKDWNLYQKQYGQVTFRVLGTTNMGEVTTTGLTRGQGVGKAVAELEELTYGYSVADRPWTGPNTFVPALLADPAKTYDMLTIQVVSKEYVTEETVIPTTYIFAIDSTIAVANKNELIGKYNLLFGMAEGDAGYIADVS